MVESRRNAVLAACAVLWGCGGRTGISSGDGGFSVSDGDLVRSCTTHADCDDGLYCTGQERCENSLCVPGTPVDCPGQGDCLMGLCDEASRGCAYTETDADADGHFPVACGGDDCDDTHAEVRPGAPEICDYLDNDCNGATDEGIAYVGLGATKDISAPEGNGRGPDLRFDGTDFDVVFDSWPASPSQVFYVSVTADGSSAAAPNQVTFSSVLSNSAELEWNGGEYGLFTHFHLLDALSNGAIALTRLSAGGSRITDAIPLTGDDPDADAPAAAWSGDVWGVAYVTNLTDGTHPIRFMRVSADGTPLEASWLLSSGDAVMLKPSVVWAGQGFAVAYVEDSAAWLALVAGDAPGVLAEQPMGTSAPVAPALAFDGAHVAMASVFADGNLVLVRLDPLGGGFGLGLGRGALRGLALAWSGGEYALSYQDAPGGAGATFLTRVGADLDWTAEGQVDSTTPRLSGATALDFNGRQYGVAYTAGPEDSGRVNFRLAGCP
jgi:putative metal-binding protein